MIDFKHFREAQALAHIKGEVLPDTNKDVTNEIIEILQAFESKFIMLFTKAIQNNENSDDFLNGLKKMMGLLKNLKHRPDEKRKTLHDPLSNTVARPHDGPDGPDGGNG